MADNIQVKDGNGVLTTVRTIDESGVHLPVRKIDKVGSVIDANNSTTTPLAGSATFTGVGTDVLGYTAVSITLTSDQDGVDAGMQFQFSMDNTNWDDVYSFDFVGGSTRRFQFPVSAQYFRVVFENDATPQTYLRIQTILHTGNILTSVHRIDNDIAPDRSATLVKATVSAQRDGGGGDNFIALKATALGNLKVSLEETVDVNVSGIDNPTTLSNGQKTVTTSGTAEALVGSSTLTESAVTVKALNGNTGIVYVGDSSVDSNNGYELSAGERISFEIDDLQKVYLDVSVNGEGVSWIAS